MAPDGGYDEAVEAALARVPAADRDAMRGLVRVLVENGATAEDVGRACEDGSLLDLVVARLLEEDAGFTLSEIASRHGLSVDVLISNRRALGLPTETEDAVYGDGADQQAKRIANYLRAGFSEEGVLLFNRVVG